MQNPLSQYRTFAMVGWPGNMTHAETVGTWRLGEWLGEGSFGEVRLGENTVCGERVAVKVIPRNILRRSEHAYRRLRREIELMSSLDHPNVLQFIEVIKTADNIHIILELAAGGQLSDRITPNSMPEEDARDTFIDLISAVSYIHSQGIAHRDLKPENILLSTDQTIKIADFGFCKRQASPDNEQAMTGRIQETACGTPSYVAPEVIKRRSDYNAFKADAWSCGIIFFEMLTGRKPFNDTNVPNLLWKISTGTFEMPDNLSIEAQDLLRRLLCVNPKNRISVDELSQHEWLTPDRFPEQPPSPTT